MTKEELEDSIYDSIWDSVYAESGLVMGCNNAVGKCLETSLEYAKIQAIEFDKWKRELGLIKEQKRENWLINLSMNECSLFAENDEQLYNLFLEHQLNNGGKYKC